MVQNEPSFVSAGPRGLVNGAIASDWLDASGAKVTIDFFAKAILDGKGYQVRAGTITTPLVGSVAIGDTAAEYCVDAVQGVVMIPIAQMISVRLGTGTLFEMGTKSVATVSSAGTAFVLLPMRSGGSAAAATSYLTARVQAAGNVTVTAELATTTLRHWSFAQPIAMGAYVGGGYWEPARPPVLRGPRCLYTQIGAATTGPSYYANLDVLQFTVGELGLAA